MTKGKKKIVLTVVFLFGFFFFYRYSPRRVEFLGHFNKVFAHRVNSLEKQKQALNYFEGIEVDLVYLKNKNVLDVNHPPSASINLTFETYLAQIDSNHFPFLWLDIKGLDATNSDSILLKLNTLFESRKYPKNKVLIETLSPEALPKFIEAGYKASYYFKSNLYKLPKEDLITEINAIQIILDQQPEIGISSNYENYELMKTYFPNKTKYLWAVTSFYNFKYFKVRDALEDNNVAVVLTKFRSLYGNR
ncbi:MAG: hypothetical protein QNK89_02435 [Lacinutrix sp.]|uniref:hypothetical protein n=1 Tax=Lacinutrix sp. TaxID=1937692 RepID=UPI0030A50A7A